MSRIISPKNSASYSFREFFLESHSYHLISKYEQSDWFSRFHAESASPRFQEKCTCQLLHREGGVWERDGWILVKTSVVKWVWVDPCEDECG